MGSISYTLISGELNITTVLRSGSTTLQTQVHTSLGSYSFTGVTEGSYYIDITDSLGCSDTAIIDVCLDCASGYTAVVGGCLKIEEGTLYSSGTPFTLAAKSYGQYSDRGLVLFSSYNLNGTGTYTKYNTNTYWTNTGTTTVSGPMNRSAIWTSVAAKDNQDISFSY